MLPGVTWESVQKDETLRLGGTNLSSKFVK